MNATHRVENQVPPFRPASLWDSNVALREALARDGFAQHMARLAALGETLADPALAEHAALANRNPPLLRTHDRYGNRIDAVEFHPSWHALLRIGCEAGLHSSPWADPSAGAHLARAAAFMMFAEIENGSQCPMSMTFGSVSAFAHAPALAADWLPKIHAPLYDATFAPLRTKRAVLVGMGMTEKQGGSDVRANTTRAAPAGDGSWRLRGHKWFTSAPMCDAFFVTAQTERGVSCFFMPRFLPDGAQNDIRIQRLKDKLGNRSNASSELEFDDTHAWLVGEEGRGIATILEMGVYTRLDCALGTSGMMHQCLSQALHHASHRSAFRKPLIEQPLMRAVLADMALETEAAIALTMRLARAYDRAGDPAEVEFRRVMTAVTKFWVCKRGIALAGEAMEVLGGNGYVEDAPLARIFREMPVNSIWEGSGNVMCLDVLRALARSPQALAAVLTEIDAARGEHAALDSLATSLSQTLTRQDATQSEAQARRLTQSIALAVQASLLLRFAPAGVGQAFCASRFDQGWGACFGALPAGVDCAALVARHRPES